MQELVIDIVGPYSFVGDSTAPSVFECPFKDSKGIYLWTVPIQDSELIYFIGETGRSFKRRLFEHLQCTFSGVYCINDPAEMLKGVRNRVWDGTGRGAKLENFLINFERHSKEAIEFIRIFHIYLLPFDCDRNLRKRIEGLIAHSLYKQDGIVKKFQEPDCRYQEPKVEGSPWRIRLNCKTKFCGLQREYVIDDS
jgi:hypothetical protein